MVGRNVYGLRLIAGWGVQRSARWIVGFLWLAGLAAGVGILRPDLLHPADLGSDTSNYVAAGERAVAGSIYVLSAGDRPAPADNPPQWSSPILSPPPVASIWRVLLVFPEALRYHVLWAAGVAGTGVLVVWLIASTPWPQWAVLVGGLATGWSATAVMAWSGNVNALVAPAFALVWVLTSSQRGRTWQFAAGAIVAMCALVKLGPIFLLIWMVAQRRWFATGAAVVVATGGLITTAILLGPESFQQYASVVTGAVTVPDAMSIPGLAAAAGVPTHLQRPVMGGILLTCVAAILMFRRWPRPTFALAVAGSVLATTVVRADTLPVLFAALAPWAARATTHTEPSKRRHIRWALPSAFVALWLGAGIAAVTTGGLARTSLAIDNRWREQIIIRFNLPAQSASFGFRVDPGVQGFAWKDQMGRVTSTISIFTQECTVLAEVEAASVGETLVVTPRAEIDVIASEPLTAAAEFLPYESACAIESAPDP